MLTSLTAPNVTGAGMPTGDQAGNAASQIHNQLNPDDFIKLYLAQMMHQDPMHPMDNSQILQQMAEVSSLSATKEMEKTMYQVQAGIESALAQAQVEGASGLIGKRVEIAGDKAPLIDKRGMEGAVAAPAGATNITVTIKDKNGDTVTTIDLGSNTKGGVMAFKWDGKVKDKDGKEKTYDPDIYTISASATVKGVSKAVDTAGAFQVNSVAMNPSFDPSDPKSSAVLVTVDGQDAPIGMGDIFKIID